MDNIQSLNHRYSSIESLLTSSGKVNAKIISKSYFKELDIYEKILKESSELDIFKNIKLCDRINFISKNLQIEKCQFCGKPYIHFNNSQTTYKSCNHHFSVDRISLSNSLKTSKKNKLNSLINSLSNLNLMMDDITFNNTLEYTFNLPNNYNFPITSKTFNFLHDLIVKTSNIIQLDEKNLRFSERVFILFNRLSDIPKCKYCNSYVNFRGRRIGYSTTCPFHNAILAGEKHSEGCIETLLKTIDVNKYDIIQLPRTLSLDNLVIRCKKCGKTSIWIIKNGMLGNIHQKHLCRFCEQSHSIGEESIYDMIKECYDGNVIFKNGNRRIIPPYELDIYIPDKKIAIEYDGIYWHSEMYGRKNKNYHLMKTKLCEEKGIHLIHVFENEWLSKQHIVKSRIKNMLGTYEKTIFARKCKIENVSSRDAVVFLNENHIQGACNASIRIGLYFENEIVSLMTFSKPRFRKDKIEWELVRFCNKNGYHVPGAASKMLKFFEINYSPKNIISYADRRWSNGNLYKTLGFKLTNISKPNYWYFKRGNSYDLINRIKCQKHRLKKVLKNFDESKTEFENMVNNGYDRIFDCGNLVFVKEYD